MRHKSLAMFALNYGILLMLIALLIFFSVMSPNFMTVGTMVTILKQIMIIGIVSIGSAFVILTGGIDLSVGSVAAVSAVTAAILMLNGMPVLLACLVTVLIAGVYGAINGLLITKIAVPPLIATLATMTSLRGLAFIITGGLPVFGFSTTFGQFASGTFLGLPYPVILLLALYGFAIWFLGRTTMGRYIYGVGSNQDASRLSGINVGWVKIFTYMVSGLLAGVAGLVLLSRTNSGQPGAASGYEMEAITSVVLGGIALTGGEGKISLVLVGAVIMGVLKTGMVMLNVNDYVQIIVQGGVLILAVALSVMTQRIRKRLADLPA
ncbi:MAG: ABC transporter permease [Salana multivorans]|nr:ABC transporter permease [Salana multivorans]